MHQARRIAVKLNLKAETILKKGHPWIFSDSILKVTDEAQTGDVAVIFAQKDNKLIGVGLYDAESPIRIKILQANRPMQVDAPFFLHTITIAFNKRKDKISNDTNAYRLIYGEGDGLPGVIVDVYDQVAVMKLYSGIWIPYITLLKKALVAVLQPEALVLRISRNVAKLNTEFEDGDVLYGTLDDPLVHFKEFGVAFRAHVIKGHKTGYFLDHRSNRHKVGQLAKGKTVLDVFSYAGGFSVHALVGGAEAVSSIDISAQALEVARENAALNIFKGQHETLKGDAFELLAALVKEGRQYDIVVIDPPSFAKQQSEVQRALKQYEKLAMLGAALCSKGGVLVLASCSSRVAIDNFKEAHQQAFKKAGVKPRILMSTQHDWDHPVTIPESAYLKTIYYSI
ncbi:MAG: class I SAM-dependent rRNA methyltransferase [Sphingobacteriales bacterium]|nr:MAG: class I SAM-dependent rRNA methyltransferase [Sphingobacteriales bacterium]